jgi:hypothetical protein
MAVVKVRSWLLSRSAHGCYQSPLMAVIKVRSRLLSKSAHGCYRSLHLLLSLLLCLMLVSLTLNSRALGMLTLLGFTIG